jgi:hypothetical protein
MSFDNPSKAFVQGEGSQNGLTPQDIPPGVISWEEHEEAWMRYHAFYPNHQTALTINMRGGFGYWELKTLLGRSPSTWRPRDETRYAQFEPAEKKER